MNLLKVFRVLWLVIVIGAAMALFTLTDSSVITFAEFKANMAAIKNVSDQHIILSSLVFLTIYVISTGLSLPGAGPMTLAAGALYPLWWGLLLSSIAATLGATLSFVIARFLIRDWVLSRFRETAEFVNRGVRGNGIWYLLSLRLVPLTPFVVINLVMGITAMPVRAFFWTSYVGMLPSTALYVLAGRELVKITNPTDVLSTEMILALVALAALPLALREFLKAYPRTRRLLTGG